jgi:hypothetical protein
MLKKRAKGSKKWRLRENQQGWLKCQKSLSIRLKSNISAFGKKHGKIWWFFVPRTRSGGFRWISFSKWWLYPINSVSSVQIDRSCRIVGKGRHAQLPSIDNLLYGCKFSFRLVWDNFEDRLTISEQNMYIWSYAKIRTSTYVKNKTPMQLCFREERYTYASLAKSYGIDTREINKLIRRSTRVDSNP